MENVSSLTEVDPISLFKFTLIVAQCEARNLLCRSKRHAERRHHIPKRSYRVTGHPTQSPTADPCTALPVRRPKPSPR